MRALLTRKLPNRRSRQPRPLVGGGGRSDDSGGRCRRRRCRWNHRLVEATEASGVGAREDRANPDAGGCARVSHVLSRVAVLFRQGDGVGSGAGAVERATKTRMLETALRSLRRIVLQTMRAA